MMSGLICGNTEYKTISLPQPEGVVILKGNKANKGA